MAVASGFRALSGLLIVLLFALVTGCGGGSGDGTAEQQATGTTPATPEPVTENYFAISAVPLSITPVRVGEVVTLNDTASFADSSEPLSYGWSFTHIPEGSQAVLNDASSATPSFVADVRGVYMVQLVVSAEGVHSQRAVSTVVVTDPDERPTGPFNHVGLSSNCVQCHHGNIPSTQSMPPTHMATSNNCQTCHTPQGFSIAPFVDHIEVFGSCSECHNGVIAVGKSAFHAPTEDECDVCHNISHFLRLNPDGSFDHSNITTACSACHNGTVATGMTPVLPVGTHPDTGSECGFCHTTTGFLPAFPDHTGSEVVGKRCDSCHNGATATGQSIGHPVTSVDCGVCHGNLTFSLGGVFDHSAVGSVSQPCADCHTGNNSINAIGMSSAHIAISEDCGVCHNTASFTGAVFDHGGITNSCASCHGVTATGKSVNHMPTSEDCSACHTAGTFATGSYDHAGVVNNCTFCHNGLIAAGKPTGHLPTTRECAVCHNTTAFRPTTFAHQGIDASNCAQCHNGSISVGKPPGHVPTTLDCSSCHLTSNFTTFAGVVFNHLGIDSSNCSSCHDDGIAAGKSGITGTHVHIPTRDDCSVCHNSTSLFTTTNFLTSVHQRITRGCEGCHVNKFFPDRPELTRSASHLPTEQDCDSCHTVTTFVPSVFSHGGITDNCVSCHDGSASHVAVNAPGEPDTPIHLENDSDCSVCHNTTSFTAAFVDHAGPEVTGKRCDSCHNGIDATGKAAKTNPPHVSTSEDCSLCHVPGGTFVPAVFEHQGIAGNCASCHDGVAATGKSTTHLPTTEDCSACHVTSVFIGARFDHAGITDDCASCHNGVTARGRTPPPDHVPTNKDCSLCHVTTGFIPATFSHEGIADNCATCHNGAFATGKSDSHIGTNRDCSACHNTRSFTAAVFDHSGIVDNCSSCHNGQDAIGKTSSHLPTTQDCSVCHVTTGFLGAVFNHTGVVDNCASCHDNVIALGKTLNHLPTTQDCSVCHITTGFPGVVFDHTGVVNNCASCHDGIIATGTDAKTNPPHIATTEDCHVCHTADSFANSTWIHDASTAGRCDSCHVTGSGATAKPAHHLGTSEQCDLCHTTLAWIPSRFVFDPVQNSLIVAVPGPIIAVSVGDMVVLEDTRSFAESAEPLSYNWSITSVPDGSAAVLQNAATFAPGFIADVRGVYTVQVVVSAGGLVSQRAITTVIVTEPAEPPTGPFDHQGFSSNCVNCHNDGFPTTASKPPTHMATSNNCQACHTPQGFTIIPFNDHEEVFGACSECHNNVIAIGTSEFHSPTNSECDSCHDTKSFLNLNPDGSYDHANVVRDCSGCHNGTVSIGKPEGHLITDTECGYCHTTTSFLAPYPDHTGPDVAGRRCDSCHNNTIASGWPVGHPITAVDCGICHSIVSFNMGDVFDHSVVDSVAQPCAECHNGNNSINAIGKSATHIPTTEDCGLCHNTTTFIGAVFDHTGIFDNCASCHGVTAVGKSLDHLPTDEDCSVCHTPGTFTTGIFGHDPAYLKNPARCDDCHNNVIAVGILETHLPTAEDCDVCHNTTAFVPAAFAHQGVDLNNCARCHNDVISIGKPATHLPTTLDCSSCHDTGNFTTFAGITYNHLGVDSNNCSSCHGSGISTGKSGTTGTNVHIPTQDDCGMCHDSTITFASTTFLNTVHQGYTRGCEGCHVSTFFPARPDLIKSLTHVPTSQGCDSCHTVAGFVPSVFSHTGITDNCVSCHDGSAAYVAVGALGKTDTPIHNNTSSDCYACHNTTNFLEAFVDHNSTEVLALRCDACHNGVDAIGMDAKTSPPHMPTTQDCGVCHIAGGSFFPAVFDHQGIVDNCASCHNGVSATGKSSTHVSTTEDCSTCHNTTAFIGASFDHRGIVDHCASCHDGVTAPGKTPPPDHVPTNQDCSVCHLTTGFLPAVFSHAGIVDNCFSCHNGVFAIGKTVSHVPTSQDCGVCHNTTTFIDAVFDHTGIVDNCASCHNGSMAIGMDAKTNPPHIATSLDCHFCHTTATFLGGSWVHGPETVGVCSSCHNGTDATGQPDSGHFITSAQCDDCHTTSAWAPASTYTHPNNVGYPGNHNSSVTCIRCHTANNENISGFPHSTYGTSCAACHANDYDAGEHRGTLTDNMDCGRSGCHRVSSRSW